MAKDCELFVYPRDSPQPPMVIFYVLSLAFGYAASAFSLEQLLQRLLPIESARVLAAGAFLFWIVLSQLQVSQFAARCKYGVGHPLSHPAPSDVKEVKDRVRFLTYTRALEHTLEQFPAVAFAALVVAFGLHRVHTAAVCFAWWALSRAVYARGYTSGDMAGRYVGLALGMPPAVLLFGICGFSFVESFM